MKKLTAAQQEVISHLKNGKKITLICNAGYGSNIYSYVEMDEKDTGFRRTTIEALIKARVVTPQRVARPYRPGHGTEYIISLV